MNRLQLVSLICALSSVGSEVLGGLLPEGGSAGYQYNRPATGGGLFGGDFGRRSDSLDRFGARPGAAYGAPGYTGNAGIGNFGVRPAGVYPPGFGYQGTSPYQGAGPLPGVGGVGYQGAYPGYQGDYSGGYQGDGRPRPYTFQYEVRDPPSGNDYGQQESSDGNIVRGEYRVLLPDSRTQIVKYTADDINGYNAEVQYEGQAQFPRPGQFGGYQGGGYPGYNAYQPGRGGYGGVGDGFSGTAGSNQYLPPVGGYGK